MGDGPAGASCCDHCRLPVDPRGARSGEALFCCVGCRLAAAVAGGQGDAGLLEARLLLAAFLAMGVMTFSLVLYGEAVYAPAEDPELAVVRNLGRLALAFFSLPVLLLLGPPLLQGAWLDLRQGAVRMDGLIVIAAAAAYGLSIHHTFTGSGDVYYETATMVLVLVTFGRRLEARARTHGRDAADALAECLPETAHRIGAAGEEADVDPRELRAGDRVRVRPGEAAPADLVVVEGESEASAAHLTGEEAPRPVGPGDPLPAGSVNGAGALVGHVERAALEGSLGRIRDLLEAPLPRTDLIRLADRLAGWLAAAAIGLAFVGGARSAWLDGAGDGIRTALSVLLVACPCALGLATPLAYRAMRAALARRGVLVRDPSVLEGAAAVEHVLLDKTGTLTEARAATTEGGEEVETIARMSALVGHSGHALGRAMASTAAAPASLRILPGQGVEGTLAGVACRAGSPEWMDERGMRWTPELASRRRAIAERGDTVLAYAEEDRVRAVCAVSHQLRPGSREGVAALLALGLAVEILSGDRPEAAARIADELGVPARGELRPEDKLARLAELQGSGRRVLFAGDGINDAPALRAADVGVAMGSGTALAREHARVEVARDDLRAVPRLIVASRRLRRTVRGNLAWCVGYNAVALALATLGLLHPLVAVAAMIASSIAVSARSYRLLGWEPQ